MNAIEPVTRFDTRATVQSCGVVRIATQAERQQMLAHLLRLTVDDRCRRFCGTVSDDFLHRYCLEDRPYERIVAGYWAGGVMRGAGELVLSSPGAPIDYAEIALSVETPFQDRGVGTGIFRQLLAVAAQRNTTTVRVVSQRDNRRLRALALKFDAKISNDMAGDLEMFFTPSHAIQFNLAQSRRANDEAA